MHCCLSCSKWNEATRVSTVKSQSKQTEKEELNCRVENKNGKEKEKGKNKHHSAEYFIHWHSAKQLWFVAAAVTLPTV